MTARELLNLINWLKVKGHSDDEIIDCLETVANVADGEAILLTLPEN